MLLALIPGTQERAKPLFSGQRATCPHCDEAVIGKCGTIVIHHWSHLAGSSCDPWIEAETDWHRKWKEHFAAQGNEIEVTLQRDGERHRADVVFENRGIVEIQHSPISVEEIAERERFYGDMAWIFDVQQAVLSGRLELRNQGSHYSFRWRHAKTSIAWAKQDVYLDIGQFPTLFKLKKMHPVSPCGGWGVLVNISKAVGKLPAMASA